MSVSEAKAISECSELTTILAQCRISLVLVELKRTVMIRLKEIKEKYQSDAGLGPSPTKVHSGDNW
jgi:hypothetical protein